MVKDNVKRSKPESGYAAADDDLAFSRLSDEELLAVLRFLPAGDLVHGVMAVSPKLSRLARYVRTRFDGGLLLNVFKTLSVAYMLLFIPLAVTFYVV